MRSTYRVYVLELLNVQHVHLYLCNVMTTEYKKSANGRFLAYIPSWWKNAPWLVRVGGARQPPFTLLPSRTLQSCSVRSSREGRLGDTFPVFHSSLYLYSHKVLTYVEYRPVSGVFPNIDPPPPLHPASVSSPRTKGGGGGYTLARRWGGGGSIFWKTPDIGLASYRIISQR